ncbi:MAG TPA: SprT family zinc-dependent metalloprotease [Thermomicrobiales bacterium]|nr:SprT family zinc-dependent metalloprotease [Thermomicrobiales bacterium]
MSYTVRHSERARRMSLRVLPGRGLEVVLPRGSSLRDAEGLVRREQDWVLRALERFSGDGGDGLRGGASLPWLDERLTLSLEPGERVSVTRAGDIVTITTTDSQLAALALEAWYRAQARVVLRERALRHASTLRVEVRRVTIKDTRSRWGSCSERGNLNFSWRLMLAPRAVMDYVVAHEVAHLRELNHSPRFWAHVAALCPDYRAQRRWLRLHGAALAGWPATVIPDA